MKGKNRLTDIENRLLVAKEEKCEEGKAAAIVVTERSPVTGW